MEESGKLLAGRATHAKGASTPWSRDERGETQAIEELFRGCERRLGAFLVQVVGDRPLAEDLLQDTFHDAFRLRGRLAAIENPEAWLFGIARNRALAALRRHRRFLVALERLVQRAVPSEPDDLELLALRDLLERHLGPEDRALLILRYVHGFDAAELGTMTGRSPEAIRQRLSRAKAHLIHAAGLDEATHPVQKESQR